MKIRQSIIFLTAVAVLLIGLVLWHGKKQPAEKPAATTMETNSAPAETSETRSPVLAAVVPTNAPAANAVAAPNPPKPSPANKVEQMQGILSTYNDVPIDFYGKLLDQFSNPVVGAEITGSIIFDNGSSNGVRQVQTTSDGNGLFALHGGNGESLSVTPRKQGYALASDNAGFKYSHFYPEARRVPNPSQPVVIEMRKLQGAERLIHYQSKVYVPLDGSPVRLDLQTGRRVDTGGDIIIRVESSPIPNATEKYDWKATVQAVNGGLATTSTEFEKMYAAPESGYEPEFVVSYAKDSQPWANGFTGGFYLKSRGGSSYGKLGFGVNTDIVKNGAVFVMLNAYVNPAGSLNLEVEPALVAEAKP